MGMFIDRTEDDDKTVITFKLAACFYWLMWLPLLIVPIAFVTGFKILYLLAAFLFLLVFALAVPFWSTTAEIKRAFRTTGIKASGSKYSFSNPLRYEIPKEGDK